MSNRRKSPVGNRYRTGFLTSPAWRQRRDRWFRTTARRHIPLVCAGCQAPAVPGELELHHLSYAGIRETPNGWTALERHADLIPLHHDCHQTLHRLLDRDRLLSRHRTRTDATRIALSILHPTLQRERGAA